MLVLANGGFKTGSSWLYNVVSVMAGYERVPDRFQVSTWRNSSVAIDDVPELCAHSRSTGQDYFAKTHLFRVGDIETVMALHPEVRVALMDRDHRDIVVSAYYHYQRLGQTSEELSFEEFFLRENSPSGRSVLSNTKAYRSNWSGVEPVYRTSFELMMGQFEVEVSRLADFLSIEVDPAAIERVKRSTAFENRPSGKGKHLRLGQIGDHRNHFSDDLLALADRWLVDPPPIAKS